MFKRVYFILCPNYHGATVLSKYFNAHPNVLSLGDTYPMKPRNRCGCGERYESCPYWQEVHRLIKTDHGDEQRVVYPLYPESLKFGLDKFLYNYAPTSILKGVISKSKLADFRQDYETYLKAVATVDGTGSEVFVDGSKSISKVIALHLSGFPVAGIIQLMRDPYDFVESSQNSVPDRIKIRATVKNALLYRMFHQRAKHLGKIVPSITVKYHEFCENNKSELKRYFKFIEVDEVDTTEGSPYWDDLLNKEWHLIGNKSVKKFDGNLRCKKYPVKKSEARLVRAISKARSFGY